MGLLKKNKIIIAPRGETFDEALDFKKKKKSFYIEIAKKLNLYRDVYWHASTEVEKQSIVKIFTNKSLTKMNLFRYTQTVL